MAEAPQLAGQGHTDTGATGKTAAQLATETATAAAAAAAAHGKDGQQHTAEAQAAADGAAAAAAARHGAPDTYSLKLPDGGLFRTSDLKVLEEQARKANLTNEDAQAWIDEQALLLKATSDAYHAETTADKDYGGEKLVESQRLANAVIDRIRPAGHARRDGFLAFIKAAGADNSIHVVSFLADLGRLMGEDSVVSGKGTGGGSGARKSDAEVMFGETAAAHT